MKIFKHYSLSILSLALFCSALLCFADDVSNPQRQGGYEQCVRQCQQRRPGQVEECHEICGERQGREPQRRSQEECERRCSWETRGQREQQQCEESCRGRRQDDDEDQNSHRDPRHRFEECSERCESQQRGQQQDCRRRCQKEYERESEREEHRRGRGDDNSQDPRQRYQHCQRQCQEHVRGQEAQQQCQRRCEEERHRQESEGRQHTAGTDESRRDPRQRYQECQSECRRQEKGSQQQQCQRTCQDQYERERQESERRRGRGDEANAQDPRRRFEECREECEKQEHGGGSKQQCQRSCHQEYERQKEESEQGRGRVGERGEQEQEQRDNPYFFQSGHFQESFRSSDGSLRFLPKFISKSRLLRGLNHFRFAHLQAGPNTVYLPHHSDSDSVCVVTRGKGTITFVNHENKESFNIEQGNVVRVPAGNTVYIVNRQSNETLKVAIFVNPVNNPGEFEDFYPAGVESPRSYFRAFSTEILEQALNTPREQIEKLFQGREQQQGIIRRASEEQLRAIIRHASSSRSKKGDIRSPIDLTNQKPVYSNDNGRFFEAVPSETFRQLEDIDISVGIIDLKQGAMFAPHFNTRTTYVVHVAEGEAQVEMACPHLSRGGSRSYERRGEEYGEEEEERTGQIQSVRFRVSAGDVFIIPAGHPITMVATGNQNLRAVGFGANARNNERVFLAGRENLLRQMDSEVKEVAFGVPAKLVDEIFSNPKESYFLSRRGQRREQGGDEATPLSSIVDELTRLF